MADELGCDVVYALGPRRPLEETMEARARELADEELRTLGHTMDLEAQGLSVDDLSLRIEQLTADVKSRPGLWRPRDHA